MLWLCLPVPASAQENDFEDEIFELVLGVKRNDPAGRLRDDAVLTNSLLGFQRGFSGYYLPLKGLAELLELYVEVDPEKGTAQGWYLSPENTYQIDVNAGNFTVRGELVDLASGDAFAREYAAGFGDIYVRMEVLEQIWPLKMEMDFSRLQLLINTEEKLPYELRLQREERRERFLNQANNGIDTTGFKFIDNPYRLFSRPAVDIDTSVRWEQKDKTWENETTISGINDLLGFSADYQVNMNYRDNSYHAPDDMRMTLTRRAWDHEDPMFLGIREVKLGDVGTATSELVSNGDSGRGASVSSQVLSRIATFDDILIEGSAKPGWDVELYRGGELLDFGVVDETGMYRFEHVPLFGGTNQIRVMLYGPAGQVEERVEEHWVGNSPLAPGEVEYNGTIVDVSDNLISFDEEDQSTFRSQRGDLDGYAYNAGARIGVNRWMSAFATANRSVENISKEKYATVGTDLSLGPAVGRIEFLKNIGGGNALDTRLLTNLLGWRLSLRAQKMNDFESERVGFGEDAKTLDLRAGALKTYSTSMGRVGIGATAEHEKLKNESTRTRYELSKDISLGGQVYGNRLSANLFNGHLDNVDGTANAFFHLGRRTTLRNLLDYTVKPHFNFTTASVDLDYRHSDKLSMGLNLRRDLRSEADSIGTNISYDFGKFLGSVNTNWRENEGMDVTLRASSSLAPFGEGGSYIMSSRNISQQGGLNSRVFLDQNLDYAFNDSEMPVEDAVLIYGTRMESLPADEYGFVSDILSADGDYEFVRFKEESTQNPFHLAGYPGFGVQMRPGILQSINFPLVESGIVDGTAYFSKGAPVPGLRLQLIDAYGNTVKETMTAFDGFYTFEFVRPGTYIIRSDPALGVYAKIRLVTISPDALFAYGVDVELMENAGLPPSEVVVDKIVARQNIVPLISSLSKLQNTLKNAVAGS